MEIVTPEIDPEVELLGLIDSFTREACALASRVLSDDVVRGTVLIEKIAHHARALRAEVEPPVRGGTAPAAAAGNFGALTNEVVHLVREMSETTAQRSAEQEARWARPSLFDLREAVRAATEIEDAALIATTKEALSAELRRLSQPQED